MYNTYIADCVIKPVAAVCVYYMHIQIMRRYDMCTYVFVYNIHTYRDVYMCTYI